MFKIENVSRTRIIRLLYETVILFAQLIVTERSNSVFLCKHARIVYYYIRRTQVYYILYATVGCIYLYRLHSYIGSVDGRLYILV